jgi:hemophore-related protein
MLRLSLTRLAAAVGGVAFALTAGAGIASADPLDPVVNTTCNYGQVMAALNATDPAAAAQLTASPMATGYLRQFLASPPPKRMQMAQQIQAMPQAAPYFNDVLSVAGTCNNY